jgi:pimeloyl-ACP methyl ester carboxylesterase
MNYGVLVGDLVGFGVNKDKRLNELNLIADVKASIKEASRKSPDKPITLVSHSMGTALQTNALARIFQEEEESGNFTTKVKDIVLVSPWDKIASLIQDYHDRQDWNKIKDAVSPGDSVAELIDKNHDRAEELAKAVFGSNWDTLDSLHQILEMNKLRPPEYRIQNINVIHGQEDPFVSHERSKALITLIFALHERGDMVLPNARFCLIEDGNHFDMQSDENQTYFPISNIAQILKIPPQGIESGSASFGKANYNKTQVEKLNNSDLLALTA